MAIRTVLLQNGGIFYQDDRFHKMGLDSVLLADFAPVRKNQRICDLGAGQGVLEALLLQREPSLRLTGIELMPEAAEIAKKNILENGWENQAEITVGDFREVSLNQTARFDLVISNPPYFKQGSGKASGGDGRQKARSEQAVTAGALCKGAAGRLNWGGEFAFCHRPERLTDLVWALRENGLEPKKLRLVYKNAESAPRLFLMTAKKGASPALVVLPPLVLQGEDGEDSPEIKRIYCR